MKALQALVPPARVNPWHWGRAEVLKFWEREALDYLGICVGCEWGVPGAGPGQAPGSSGAAPTHRAGLAARGACTGVPPTWQRWQPQVRCVCAPQGDTSCPCLLAGLREKLREKGFSVCSEPHEVLGLSCLHRTCSVI